MGADGQGNPGGPKLDSQQVELLGRNLLVSELLRSGIEVARPERDRGVDLIAYLDKDLEQGRFTAVPMQMKASQGTSISVSDKFGNVASRAHTNEDRFTLRVFSRCWFVSDPWRVRWSQATCTIQAGTGWGPASRRSERSVSTRI